VNVRRLVVELEGHRRYQDPGGYRFERTFSYTSCQIFGLVVISFGHGMSNMNLPRGSAMTLP
jgi:hypothetical protein